MDLEDLESIKSLAKEKIEKINTEREWIDTKAYFLGKKGIIPSLLAKLPELSQEQKKIYGQSINTVKVFIESLLEKQLKIIKAKEIEKKLSQNILDITLPGKYYVRTGAMHPISLVIDEIIDIFTGMGFEVQEGPEIESDYYNFEALNIPEEHPAREMQDTFYISDGFLLRTHTSPVQIRVMEKNEPPLHVICPGKVYRRDSDITHSPMFHQVEGFVVDKDIHFGHLKGVLTEFLHRFYGENMAVRFRPSYFPFTEPSAEVDIQCVVCNGKGCRICKNSGWLEVLGCGMIHPYLFSVVGYDKEIYSGFAFGLGVERLTMLKYAIDDIRLFYENNLSFLEQF